MSACLLGIKSLRDAETALLAPPPVRAFNARKEATCFRYPSDGSGRDSYILYNSGGLHADYVPGGQHHTFYNSLRKHEKLPDVRKRSNSNKRFKKRNS